MAEKYIEITEMSDKEIANLLGIKEETKNQVKVTESLEGWLGLSKNKIYNVIEYFWSGGERYYTVYNNDGKKVDVSANFAKWITD